MSPSFNGWNKGDMIVCLKNNVKWTELVTSTWKNGSEKSLNGPESCGIYNHVIIILMTMK